MKILLKRTQIFKVNPKYAQSAGFEPARAEPNGFLVHRLNHSATTALVSELPFLAVIVQRIWVVHGMSICRAVECLEGFSR